MKCWTVEIVRRDGTSFYCASAHGDFPPVWANKNRRFAVAHKRELQAAGFKARVVAVEAETPTPFIERDASAKD